MLVSIFGQTTQENLKPARVLAQACGLISLLILLGCGTVRTQPSPLEDRKSAPPSMAQQVRDLGAGLRFVNSPVPKGALTPETGADYVYARTFSANSRNSPVGIEIWVFDGQGNPLHPAHEAYLQKLYQDIYGWDPIEWKTRLGESKKAPEILRTKSDFFWESLAQHLAERIFGETITPAKYRFGPTCFEENPENCQDEGIAESNRVVVRTFLDARRDPMNPVTRSITYSVGRGHLTHPELFFELHVPNGLQVAGPHQEFLDFRPIIDGRQDTVGDISLWAHLPDDRRSRTKNFDYPDYNLLFVPLRHLVVQGEVENPKQPASGFRYPDRRSLIHRMGILFAKLRTPEGAQSVVAQLNPFLSPKYYYMFETGGQGITSYRNYILGDQAGIGRGLNPDFGRIELLLDGHRVASFAASE